MIIQLNYAGDLVCVRIVVVSFIYSNHSSHLCGNILLLFNVNTHTSVVCLFVWHKMFYSALLPPSEAEAAAHNPVNADSEAAPLVVVVVETTLICIPHEPHIHFTYTYTDARTFSISS